MNSIRCIAENVILSRKSLKKYRPFLKDHFLIESEKPSDLFIEYSNMSKFNATPYIFYIIPMNLFLCHSKYSPSHMMT